jgi:hypothetical protein
MHFYRAVTDSDTIAYFKQAITPEAALLFCTIITTRVKKPI